MTGVAIATGIAAVATGLGAYLNYQGQRQANQTNENLMREQMAYQTSERLAAQEYNTPVNQRARFEAAGINPYMALGQIDAGNTQAMSGVSSPDIKPASLGDTLEALGQAPSQVVSSIQGVQQIQAQSEAIKQAKVETLYKERNMITDLNQKKSDIALKLSQKDLNEESRNMLKSQIKDLDNQIKMHQIDADYHEQYIKSRNSKEQNLADLAYQQQVGQFIQNNYQQMVNDAFPSLNAAQIGALKAQTSQAYSAANLSNKMSDTEIEKKAGVIADNQIKALEKAGWKKNYDAEQKLKRANNDYIRIMTRKVRASNNWVQNYSPLAGIGAAAIK